MDLVIGRITTLPKVYPYVMNETVIKAAEKLAESQGFKTLIFLNHRKKVFFPCADMLAGVYRINNDNVTDDIQEGENE